MVDYKELRKILNSSGMSVKKYGNGKTEIRDSMDFRGMSQSKLEEAQDLVINATKDDVYAFAEKQGRKDEVDTLDSITRRANQNIGIVVDCLKNKPSTPASKLREKMTNPVAMRDSIINGRWSIGNGVDPSTSSFALPNIWISPYEANALYSQKGIFETIINKKSKSILLNGMEIENKHLTQRQIDDVKENMERKNFKSVIADGTLTSLVYGGCLVFPMFKQDTPATTQMRLSQLLKLGILKKNSVDWFVTLDRWNTFIVPPYNPTQKDFLMPEVFTIPYLGSDVHHSRCARIVTARQAGYWGQIMQQGWGISDLMGYLQSGMNYKVAIQSLPLMIQQMSILARTINVDGVLATEGANALDGLIDNDTIRTREASADNPITMDVLGDIKSIDRNFGQVPELIRLLRQDVASDATIPEPMLFSSEKGNFSSGDDTQGNLAKQWEAVKTIHKAIEPQFDQLAKIMVIDALGTSKEVLDALPYTKIHFDEPIIANALERAQIGKFNSENIFNLVSARLPLDVSVEIASQYVSSDMAVTADTLDKLKKIQAEGEALDKQNSDLEHEKTEAEIEQIKQNTKNAEKMASMPQQGAAGIVKGSSKSSKKSDKETKGRSPAEEQREKAESDKEEKGYSKLEQKMHEKTRIGSTKRSEKLAKSQNKSV